MPHPRLFSWLKGLYIFVPLGISVQALVLGGCALDRSSFAVQYLRKPRTTIQRITTTTNTTYALPEGVTVSPYGLNTRAGIVLARTRGRSSPREVTRPWNKTVCIYTADS